MGFLSFSCPVTRNSRFLILPAGQGVSRSTPSYRMSETVSETLSRGVWRRQERLTLLGAGILGSAENLPEMMKAA